MFFRYRSFLVVLAFLFTAGCGSSPDRVDSESGGQALPNFSLQPITSSVTTELGSRVEGQNLVISPLFVNLGADLIDDSVVNESEIIFSAPHGLIVGNIVGFNDPNNNAERSFLRRVVAVDEFKVTTEQAPLSALYVSGTLRIESPIYFEDRNEVLNQTTVTIPVESLNRSFPYEKSLEGVTFSGTVTVSDTKLSLFENFENNSGSALLSTTAGLSTNITGKGEATIEVPITKELKLRPLPIPLPGIGLILQLHPKLEVIGRLDAAIEASLDPIILSSRVTIGANVNNGNFESVFENKVLTEDFLTVDVDTSLSLFVGPKLKVDIGNFLYDVDFLSFEAGFFGNVESTLQELVCSYGVQIGAALELEFLNDEWREFTSFSKRFVFEEFAHFTQKLLDFTRLPDPIKIGEEFDVEVTVRNNDGQVDTTSREIQLALETSPPGSFLSGDLRRNTVNGVASFPGLSLNIPGRYAYVATSNGVPRNISVEITAEVDQFPTINIISPTGNSPISGDTDISVNANDDVKVTQVEFFVDNSSIGIDTTAPYTQLYDTNSIDDGEHEIKAIVTDSAGQTSEDIVNVSVQNVVLRTVNIVAGDSNLGDDDFSFFIDGEFIGRTPTNEEATSRAGELRTDGISVQKELSVGEHTFSAVSHASARGGAQYAAELTVENVRYPIFIESGSFRFLQFVEVGGSAETRFQVF